MKYRASCSGGKDSVWMIEEIINRNLKLDEIVFCSVEKEFKQEIIFRQKLIDRWFSRGIKCSVISTDDSWDNWFYGKSTRGNSKGKKRGFPLTLYPCWWSREAKFKVLDNYMQDGYRYIGIAADEPERYHPEKEKDGYIYPLCEWGVTESKCRRKCYKNNILNPLYEYFDRLGCYLCPKQNTRSLTNLCKYFPKEWNELGRYIKDSKSSEFCTPGYFNKIIPNYTDYKMFEKNCRDQIALF